MKPSKIVSWICQIAVAIIIGQTLYFKFSAHPESVQLFTELGMEPEGRIMAGVSELLGVVLILIPMSAVYGAIFCWGVMSGAILAHITILGWEGERGVLGGMAVIAWLLCVVVIYLRRDQAGFIKRMFARKKEA